MRIPGVPSPGAVLGSAVAAAEAVESALALVPRAVAAMDRVETLLDRAEAAVLRVEVVSVQAGGVVDRVEEVMTGAEAATAGAAAVVAKAGTVTTKADRAIATATGISERSDVALQTWEPTLRRLAPSAERFAAALETHEVDAAIALVDRLPVLLEHMESDVLPVLASLDRVGPDLHEVLEVVEDLRRVISGLPGIGLLRRRGDDEPPPLEDGVHDDVPTRRPRRRS